MADDSPNSETVTLGVELLSADWKLRTAITVPVGPTRLVELLPLAHGLADAVTGMAEKAVEKQGQKITCKKGCGACCRSLVPISAAEARSLRELVEKLPEPRRSHVLARFAEAVGRLDQAGLLEKLRARERWTNSERKRIETDYFLHKIACPFLEDEACSIYAERPATCREFLVTSPAEKCALPTNDEVQVVKRPFSVMSALARFDPLPPPAEHIRWVPLVLALGWAAEQPEEAPPRPGPELAQELFQHVADRVNARLAIHQPEA
jgi:Fe-S-cluster containining protein